MQKLVIFLFFTLFPFVSFGALYTTQEIMTQNYAMIKSGKNLSFYYTKQIFLYLSINSLSYANVTMSEMKARVTDRHPAVPFAEAMIAYHNFDINGASVLVEKSLALNPNFGPAISLKKLLSVLLPATNSQFPALINSNDQQNIVAFLPETPTDNTIFAPFTYFYSAYAHYMVGNSYYALNDITKYLSYISEPYGMAQFLYFKNSLITDKELSLMLPLNSKLLELYVYNNYYHIYSQKGNKEKIIKNSVTLYLLNKNYPLSKLFIVYSMLSFNDTNYSNTLSDFIKSNDKRPSTIYMYIRTVHKMGDKDTYDKLNEWMLRYYPNYRYSIYLKSLRFIGENKPLLAKELIYKYLQSNPTDIYVRLIDIKADIVIGRYNYATSKILFLLKNNSDLISIDAFVLMALIEVYKGNYKNTMYYIRYLNILSPRNPQIYYFEYRVQSYFGMKKEADLALSNAIYLDKNVEKYYTVDNLDLWSLGKIK